MSHVSKKSKSNLFAEFMQDLDLQSGSGMLQGTDMLEEFRVELERDLERGTLDFFGYVSDKLMASENHGMSFRQILPEEANKSMAAEAFHHLLVLCTRGQLYPEQHEAYGDIQVSLVL
jgi:chromatin segregation and condensation protein Rec8/ScpA/Scc1 (kleisin family)